MTTAQNDSPSKGSRNDPSVLIAGCGSIGRRHARVLREVGVTDLRACDPLPAQRDALSRETPVRMYSSYEEALADRPGTVFVCTPPKLHIPMALQALASGAHVFCEKPLSDTSRGLDELVAASQRTGRQVMTGLCFRYHAGLLRAKRLLERGEFGRLVGIRCLVGEHFPTVRPDYRTLFSAKYGGAFDLTHEVDLALWFAGLPVNRVRCLAGQCSDVEMEAPDSAEILIGFEGKCLASVHLDFFQMPRRRQTELLCTQGVIAVEFSRWDRCTLSTARSDGIWTREEMVTDRDDMFRAEDEAFLDAISAGRLVECGIDEARKSVEVVERAQADAGVAVGQEPGSGHVTRDN